MRAILLAAGRGRRLEASGWLEPKCLLPFQETTILDNMLDALVAHGVHDVTLVVGYRQELVRAAVEARGDIRATWVENPDYETTNTINSLWRARESMHEDFLYFNADVLFHADVVGRLLAAEGSRLAVDHKSCAEEEVKVVQDEAGRVLEIGKKLDPARCAGEFIGIAKFERSMNEAFIASLERHNLELGNVNLFFEAAVHDIVGDHPLHEVDVSDLPAIEIDFPEDLRQARETVAPLILGTDQRGTGPSGTEDPATSEGTGSRTRSAEAAGDANQEAGRAGSP